MWSSRRACCATTAAWRQAAALSSMYDSLAQIAPAATEIGPPSPTARRQVAASVSANTPPPRSRRRVSTVAPRGRRHPEAGLAGCGPEVTRFRVGYEPQPRAVHPGIGAERIATVKLVEPAAVGQGHRAENGPSLIVLAVVLECLAVVALPALCDEAYGLLDGIAAFAAG